MKMTASLCLRNGSVILLRRFLKQNTSKLVFGIVNSKSRGFNLKISRVLCSMTATSGDNRNVGENCHIEKSLHLPVMVDEAIDMLQPADNQVIIDMTFGAGGHTKEILKQAPNAKIFALDRDPLAFSLAQDLATSQSSGQIIPLLGKFSGLSSLLSAHGMKENSVDGILFDVGVSSMQFDLSERGFSLSRDGPLDMRMDGNRDPSQLTAADVVNTLDESDLYVIIKRYGEEKLARHIAHAIVDARHTYGKITRTRQLAEIISMAFQGSHRRDKLNRHSHVATKTFQALRIFVNDELNELNNGLESARYFLKTGGRCVAIGFHSLEDRIVKRHFHGIIMENKFNMSTTDHYRNSIKIHSLEDMENITEKVWSPISRKVISPSYEDSMGNPRARSAKLRGAIKL